MLERFGIARDFDVDHQAQRRQIDAASSHVCGNADPCAAIAHCLQRRVALALAVLARQRHRGESAFDQRGMEVADIVASGAEQQRGFGIVEAQQVDHRVLDLRRGDGDCLIGNVAMTALLANGRDPQGIALEAARERDNRLGHGRRKQQRSATVRSGAKQFLQVFAEAHVEHFVSLIEHDGPERSEIERAALQVIAQPPRGADDNMRAMVQRAAFLAGVHAAHAADDPRAGFGVEPGQFAADLEREFAGRRDHQRERSLGEQRQCAIDQQFIADRKSKRDSLARAGLRRNNQIAAARALFDHGGLNRGKGSIAMRGERFGKKRSYIWEHHDGRAPTWTWGVWLVLFFLRLTPVRESHPAFPCNTSPLPRPDLP